MNNVIVTTTNIFNINFFEFFLNSKNNTKPYINKINIKGGIIAEELFNWEKISPNCSSPKEYIKGPKFLIKITEKRHVKKVKRTVAIKI